MSIGAGTIIWAIVPFVPEAPFTIYAGTDNQPVSVPVADTIIDAIASGGIPSSITSSRQGCARFSLLTNVISERYDEHLALRLARTGSYSSSDQAAIRAGDKPARFHV